MSSERSERTTEEVEKRARERMERAEEVAKEGRERIHRAKEAALDVAIGGPALAAEKAGEAMDDLAARSAKAARRGLREARALAAEATAEVRKVVAVEEGRSDGRAYEERTRDELYALAAEREIPGRSRMRKAELIEALRDQRASA